MGPHPPVILQYSSRRRPVRWKAILLALGIAMIAGLLLWEKEHAGTCRYHPIQANT